MASHMLAKHFTIELYPQPCSDSVNIYIHNIRNYFVSELTLYSVFFLKNLELRELPQVYHSQSRICNEVQ